MDRTRDDAQRCLDLLPAKFTIVYDPSGAAPAAWDVRAMPSSYLVDATGKVVLVESGFRDERKEHVEERIRAALPTR